MTENSFRIGQMFMAGFDGVRVDGSHWVSRAIRKEFLGGVILFDRNIDGSRQNIVSPDQLRAMTEALQGYADTPLLIAVDQEGGKVCRLKEEDGFSPSFAAAAVSKAGDLGWSRRVAEAAAMTLSDCGINLNLAPVVDLDLNPANPIIARYQRSYGSTVEEVVRQAAVFIAAHHASHIACCLKHFPGHGSAAADSHLGFVDITGQWMKLELEPYERLVRDGFGDAVMTAHVVHHGLDPDGLPATLSGPVISGLLRRDIGFGGVVFSDDLQMKSISDSWGFEEAVQMAVLAGVDVIIVGNNLVRDVNVVERGVKAIEELLATGRVSEERVMSSLVRIRELKNKISGERPWRTSRPTVSPSAT